MNVEELKRRVSELEAARIAYASEFPFDGNGDYDVGNIHANIRSLKADLEGAQFAAASHLRTVEQQAKIIAGMQAAPIQSGDVRNQAFEDVATWYAITGWRLDEDDVPTAIRALASTPSAAVKAPEGYTQLWLKESPDTKYVGFDIGLNFTPAGRLLNLSGCTITATPSAAMQGQGVLEGWQLVPCEPTPKMVDATFNHLPLDGESHNRRNKRIYSAMLAAAPTPPAIPAVEQAQGVPSGWKLVPVEPTEAMRKVGVSKSPGPGASRVNAVYASMLAAAPTPPAAQPQAGGRELTDAGEARDLLKRAIKYVHGAYECAFPDEQANQELIDDIEAYLTGQDGNASHITGTKGATE